MLISFTIYPKLYICFVTRIYHCKTPNKLVVYKPMGAERAEDRTIAQQRCHNKFALRIMWICAIL